MTIEEIIHKYSKGKGEEAMWKTVHSISEYIESKKDADMEAYKELVKSIYSNMQGKHYNEEFAKEQIRKMYYKDDSGVKHFAPYWTEEQSANAWHVAKGSVPPAYNEWDFQVAMNMMYSDNRTMLDEWFPDATDEEMTSKIIDMTVNYLCDEDAPHADSKVWSYFNS